MGTALWSSKGKKMRIEVGARNLQRPNRRGSNGSPQYIAASEPSVYIAWRTKRSTGVKKAIRGIT